MDDFFAGFAELFAQYDVLGAFWVNIQLTFWAALLSLLLGTVLALMRISPIASLRWAGTAYVTVFRNTPLTIILTFMFLVVFSQLGISLGSILDGLFAPIERWFQVDFDFSDVGLNTTFFWFAVIGLSVYHAAFVCEAIRSGVNTVPVGQAEAARAIGLSFLPAARLIIFPQAFRGAIAPLGNTLIALLKNSTVAAAASVADETSSLMRTMIEFRPDLMVAIFMLFAIGYVILVIPIGVGTTWLSNRLAVKR